MIAYMQNYQACTTSFLNYVISTATDKPPIEIFVCSSSTKTYSLKNKMLLYYLFTKFKVLQIDPIPLS